MVCLKAGSGPHTLLFDPEKYQKQFPEPSFRDHESALQRRAARFDFPAKKRSLTMWD
jgi:hypothetical protein